MKKSQLLNLFAFSVLFLITSCKQEPIPPPPGDAGFKHTKAYSDNVATSWFKLFADISRTTPYNPPITSRFMAYSGMTLYESVVPGMPSYQSMYKYLTGSVLEFDNKKDYYWPACANAALARISTKLMQLYSASPRLIAIDSLETLFNTSFQPLVTPERLQYSNEFGKYVADKIYEWSKTDGTLNPDGTFTVCPPYVPLGENGNWVPTPPLYFPAAGVCQGSLRTFVPSIAAATLPPPPPAYSTNPASDFYKMNQELQQISLTLTADDKNISQAWRDILGTNYNTIAHMIKLTSEIVHKENKNLEDASVIYAKQCAAMFDAVVSVFYAKFKYAPLRPVTYINGEMGLKSWASLYPTPQHPSYPAIAPGAAAAAVAILEQAFGTSYSFIDSTQNALYGSWDYTSFNGLVDDVGRSRTHSGLNFKLSVVEGAKQGRNVAAKVNMMPFKKP